MHLIQIQTNDPHTTVDPDTLVTITPGAGTAPIPAGLRELLAAGQAG